MLQVTEEVFDEMAPAIHVEIAVDLARPVGFGWDDSGCAKDVELHADPVVVEGFVGDECRDRHPIEQRFRREAVVTMPWKQQKTHKIAERIDQGDDFRRRTA